jgi:hypothetical protein
VEAALEPKSPVKVCYATSGILDRLRRSCLQRIDFCQILLQNGREYPSKATIPLSRYPTCVTNFVFVAIPPQLYMALDNRPDLLLSIRKDHSDGIDALATIRQREEPGC